MSVFTLDIGGPYFSHRKLPPEVFLRRLVADFHLLPQQPR